MKVGDLVKKVYGDKDFGMTGIIVNDTENPDEGFRRKVTVQTANGLVRWMTNSIEVLSESR